MDNFTRIFETLKAQGEEVEKLQKALTAIPALGPANGGIGEKARADFIADFLNAQGISCSFCNAPDPKATPPFRPNLYSIIPGEKERMLWLFAHMDVVPPGNPVLWRGDPWQTRREGDLLFGRGVEDNQQAICSMLILARTLKDLAITPGTGLGLVFMADEESGSKYGLQWLLGQKADLFARDALYIVPDGGSQDGSCIEIAEKAQLWLKFVLTGKQCHASMPDMGNNAFLAACKLVLALEKLNPVFSAQNSLFRPPFSTFVPTLHEKNVDAVNIMPGQEEFFMDCRLLPELPIDLVLAGIEGLCSEVARETGVTIAFKVVHRQEATGVAEDSPVVLDLKEAIKAIYQVDARPIGIGGATVAAFLRQKGLPAVVWSCVLNTCHQPEECSSISATLRDAAVFAHILMKS